MTSTSLAPILLLIAGAGIPVMAALNGGLGQRIGAVNAAACLFAVALVCTLGLMLAAPRGGQASSAPLHLHLLAGGVFVAFYVVSITVLAPRLGVATAVLLVLAGQLCSAALIDHFGLLGALHAPMTPMRWLGLALVAGGIFLARRGG
ncbi:MAG: DMT family transporter [Hyphomonas sp.]|nr:DMT family transporter [Hyphomonas sp.]